MAFERVLKIVCFVQIIFSLAHSATADRDSRNYFLVSDSLSDGEQEVRLNFGAISAKQTSVGPSEGSPG